MLILCTIIFTLAGGSWISKTYYRGNCGIEWESRDCIPENLNIILLRFQTEVPTTRDWCNDYPFGAHEAWMHTRRKIVDFEEPERYSLGADVPEKQIHRIAFRLIYYYERKT